MEEVFGKIAELMLAVSKASVELTDIKQREVEMEEAWRDAASLMTKREEELVGLKEKYNKIAENNDRMFTMIEKIQKILYDGMCNNPNKLDQIRELLKDV